MENSQMNGKMQMSQLYIKKETDKYQEIIDL